MKEKRRWCRKAKKGNEAQRQKPDSIPGNVCAYRRRRTGGKKEERTKKNVSGQSSKPSNQNQAMDPRMGEKEKNRKQKERYKSCNELTECLEQ